MTNPTTAPYGTWKSPINAELLTAKAITVPEVVVDPLQRSRVRHLEGRPLEGGRVVVVDTLSGDDVFGQDWNARNGVHEYGGGSAIAYDNVVYFTDWQTKRIHRADKSGPVPVTRENPNYRFANLAVYGPDPSLLVAVLEDHTKPAPADVVNTLVLIDTKSEEIFSTIAQGADFYSSPAFSPDGSKLAWLQWIHPDMPWEGTELHVANVLQKEGGLAVSDIRHVGGSAGTVSISTPVWLNNNVLVYLSDESGFYNPWRYDVASAVSAPILPSPVEEDYTDPAWIFGMSQISALDGDKVIATSTRKGLATLQVLTVSTGSIEDLSNPYAHITNLRATGTSSAVFTGTKLDNSTELVQCDWSNGGNPKFKVLKGTSDLASTLPAGLLSCATAYTLGDSGVHCLLTVPANPEYRASADEKPPVVVNIHGGPTGRVAPGLSWTTLYFTSRGWAWLDVNYGGSSGYGRNYRERLRGNWGIADVQDSADAVRALGERGLVDAQRAVIRGGSAGGYTVLMSLATPATAKTFAAATSSYGISDLKGLAEDTHKFESQYLFKLVGGTPAEVPEVYSARSPLEHADEIKIPLLILQGSADAVVPPNQAEAIVAKVEEQGGKVKYVVFEGEGHGWRRADTVKKALETEREFYEEVLGLVPA